MKKAILILLVIITFLVVKIKAQTTGCCTNAQTTDSLIFFDYFNNGITVDSNKWQIPTWISPGYGTFVGRTQFHCTNPPPPLRQDSMPSDNSGNAIIAVQTYNPTNGSTPSFYGTDLISNKWFKPGCGLIITVRAKIDTPIVRGIVGGIYLYALYDTIINHCYPDTLHNEIDFELLTNDMGRIHTNIYDTIPNGTGTPDDSAISSPITNYHTYVIEWFPDSVKWYVDGMMIRDTIISIPDSMYLNLNMWVPDTSWSAAYDSSLHPTTNPALNKIYSMLVDTVIIDSVVCLTTAVTQLFEQNEIAVYPNPTTDNIIIESPQHAITKILNIQGQLIETFATSGNKTNLDVSSFPSGVYIVEVKTEKGITVKKFIK